MAGFAIAAAAAAFFIAITIALITIATAEDPDEPKPGNTDMTDREYGAFREVFGSIDLSMVAIEYLLETGDTEGAKQSSERVREVCRAAVNRIDAKLELKRAREDTGK